VETVLREDNGPVTVLTLNRPERKNAISPAMWRRLDGVFAQLSASTDTRVVVITGAGDGFCSGADLSEPLALSDAIESDGSLAYMRYIGEIAAALHALPMPTIAYVNGVAAGAGLNLALGCDLVYAASTASFGELFAQRGLAIDFGGSWLLPRIVGLQRAKELVFRAELIDADLAREYGLVLDVFEGADGLQSVLAIADQIASRAPLALRQSKRLLNDAVSHDLSTSLESEAVAQDTCFATEDFSMALEAFRMKRNPIFGGR
jgi:2-(1,2-epoxy-1,2-dihydrophenyl)acetyl-CoA isomerase